MQDIGATRGLTTPEVATNRVLSQPGVTCVQMGAATAETAIENAKAGEWEFTANEVNTTDENYKRIFVLQAVLQAPPSLWHDLTSRQDAHNYW